MSHLPEFVQESQDRHGVRPFFPEKATPDHFVVFLQGLLERLVGLELLFGKLQYFHLPSGHDVSTQRPSSTYTVRVTTVMLSEERFILEGGRTQQHRSPQTYTVVAPCTRQTPVVMHLTELCHGAPNMIASML